MRTITTTRLRFRETKSPAGQRAEMGLLKRQRLPEGGQNIDWVRSLCDKKYGCMDPGV